MRKLLILVSLLLSLVCTSVFIVQEGHRGIIIRFGKVLRDNDTNPLIYKPGLHIKIPLIDKIKNLDARIQTTENQADRFVTMEKKDLIVDSYIKWRISDFSRYYLATGGDVLQAEILLKRKFSDRLRSEFGRLDVKDVVTDSRNRLMTDVRKELNCGTFKNNKNLYNKLPSYIEKEVDEKNNIYSGQTKNSSSSMSTLGIEVVDVRIKQINLPTEVSDAIYKRMRAEREAVARRHRSQGQEEAEKIRAAADYKVTHILSEAERQALIIKGEADARSSKLYADSFNKDPEFYRFLRSLHAYKNSFNSKDDILILSLENNFFQFMKNKN